MTVPSNSPEDADLLKAVLPPLLDDFQHWFGKTVQVLKANEVSFLSTEEKANLIERVRDAQKQVSASQALASATNSQAGIAMPVMMSWHGLVQECWSVAIRLRKQGNVQFPDDLRSSPE